MATKTKKSAAKKRGRPPKKKPEVNRLWSVALFGLGILLLAMTYIEGQNVWSSLRIYGLFGLFGTAAYLVAPAVLYLAVLVAMERPVKKKCVQLFIALLLVSAVLQVFAVGEVLGVDAVEKLKNLYSAGCNDVGGGAMASVLGWPLLALFGRPAADVTLVVLVAVFLMLLTDVTPVDIFGFLGRQADTAKEKRAIRREERALLAQEEDSLEPEAEDTEEAPLQTGKGRRQCIDIALDEGGKGAAIDIDLGPAAPALTEDPFAAEKPQEPLKSAAAAVQNPLDALIRSAVAKPAQTPPVVEESGQTALPLPQGEPAYRYPPITLFKKTPAAEDKGAEVELRHNAELLVNTLASFGVQTKVLDISRGPSVTRYELQPQAGVKISRITGLADDIALALATAGVRIEAPIPNKAAVGIEVPNKKGASVSIRSILESAEYENSASPLTLPLGKDIAGAVKVADLTKMPHLLIAGSTGSGKSVCINAIITSILYKASPDEVKLILIDPKVVELAEYNGIPHLLMPVVTEPRKAAGALGTAVAEMERRYRMFADNNVRDIKTYNKYAADTEGLETIPYIAIVIDELADLMMVAGKEVEDYICRLAQKARAAGMHLIVATQRPSVDVITGLIKAHIPSRVAFAVSSQVDSRTILDAGGAEKLLGMGDMLFLPVGASKPVRIQGAYVRDEEITAVTEEVKKSGAARYDDDMIQEMEKLSVSEQKGASCEEDGEERDPMLSQAIEVVVDAGQASTSMLQRRLRLGYGRAGRLIDEMEQLHIIGPHEGSKPRQVLITRDQWIEMSLNQEG